MVSSMLNKKRLSDTTSVIEHCSRASTFHDLYAGNSCGVQEGAAAEGILGISSLIPLRFLESIRCISESVIRSATSIKLYFKVLLYLTPGCTIIDLMTCFTCQKKASFPESTLSAIILEMPNFQFSKADDDCCSQNLRAEIEPASTSVRGN